MTRVALLALLVGLGVGFLLGTLSTKAPVPRSAIERPAVEPPPPVVRRRSPEPAAPVEVVPEPEATPAPWAARPAADAYTATEPTEDGETRVVVDFSGTEINRVEIVGRSITGREQVESCEREDDDDTADVEVAPGRYLVRWSEPRTSEASAVQIVVEEAKTTLLRLASVAAGDLPIPTGLGRLDVHVGAIGGGPFENAPLTLRGVGMGGAETLQERTDAHGRAQFHLIGGRYTVSIGDRIETARVAEGYATMVRIDYRNEGEIVLLPRWFGTVRLRPSGPGSVTLSHRGPRTRLLYVAAGRYQVFHSPMRGQGGFPVGSVVVRPGVATEFHYVPPRGDVRVIARSGKAPTGRVSFQLTGGQNGVIRLHARPDWGPTRGPDETEVRPGALAWFPHLPPGPYSLVVKATGHATVQREVVVGNGSANLLVKLSVTDEG